MPGSASPVPPSVLTATSAPSSVAATAAGSALSYAPSPVGTNAAFDSVSRRVRDKRLRKAAMTEEFFEEHDRATQNEEIRKSKK